MADPASTPRDGAARRAILLYDRDCGFCRWSLRKLLAWDRRKRLTPVALQDPEVERLLPAMDSERRMASWHLVTADGTAHSAGAALAPLLRLLPGGEPLAWLAATCPRAANASYAFLARHRSLFGRIVRAREHR